MPALGVAKRRQDARLDSAANTLLGWWWLDPVVALGIAGPAVREGVEAWHGEECC